MIQLNWLQKFSVWAFAGLLVSGCLNWEKESTEPVESEPTQISGTNIIRLSPSCTVRRITPLRHEVDCTVVDKRASGDIILGSLQQGLSIDWQTPLLVSGSPINIIDQAVTAGGARFRATIELENSTVTQIEFAFLAALTTGEHARASQTVSVPYSVRTYGVVAYLRDIFRPAPMGNALESAAKFLFALSEPAGFIPMSYSVEQVPLNLEEGQLSAFCELRGKLYVSSYNNIFVIEGRTVRVFAGKSAAGTLRAQDPSFADPFQVSLGAWPAIACVEGSSPQFDRIIAASTVQRAANTGAEKWGHPVTITSFRPDGQGTFRLLKDLKWAGISSMAVEANGDLLLLNVSFNEVHLARVSASGFVEIPIKFANGELSVIPASESDPRRDCGSIALGNSGEIYIAISQTNTVYRVGHDGGVLDPILGNGSHRSFPKSIDFSLKPKQIALYRLFGITTLPSGHLIVAERDADQLLLLDPVHEKLTPFLNLAVGESLNQPLRKPMALVMAKGALYVGAWANIRLEGSSFYKINLNSAQAPSAISKVTGFPMRSLSDGDDFNAATSVEAFTENRGEKYRTLRGMNSLRVRGQEFCYSDAVQGRIVCIGADKKVRVVAGLKELTPDFDPIFRKSFVLPDEGVDANAVTLYMPRMFALGADGSIYISLYEHRVILKVGTNGKITTIAGEESSPGKTGGDFEIPDTASLPLLMEHPERLVGPWSIDVDSAGVVYFADNRNLPTFKASFIKKLVPGLDGKYTVSLVAGGISTGDDAKFLQPVAGTSSLNSALVPIKELRVHPNGDLILAFGSPANSGYLEHAARMSGSFFRFSAGSLSLIAGGPNANEDVVAGDAQTARINPLSFDIASDGSIYFWDYPRSVRLLSFSPGTGRYQVQTLAENSTDLIRCGGGVVEGSGTAQEADQKWIATLNTVCLGNPLGIAVRNTCANGPNGDITLLFSQVFDLRVGNPVLVEARRGCF